MLTGLKVPPLARIFSNIMQRGGDPVKLKFLNLLKCGREVYAQTELKE